MPAPTSRQTDEWSGGLICLQVARALIVDGVALGDIEERHSAIGDDTISWWNDVVNTRTWPQLLLHDNV